MVNVLFVCMGNICRSPTAQGLFEDLLKRAKLEGKVQVDSAGTLAFHAGEAPDPRSMKTALRHGIDLSRQRARAVEDQDFERFDYVVAMDEQNLRELKAMCPVHLQNRLHLLCDFGSEDSLRSVPDPYFGGRNGFERVFDIVRKGSEGLLTVIRSKHFGA